MESRRISAPGKSTVGTTGAFPLPRAVAPAPTLELRCGECGYGLVVRRPPPACPMCGRRAWEPAVWRPFTRLAGPPEPAA